ncbi:MAG: M14 family metallopeptidase [Kangiellaceae bacterium]
MSTPFISAEFKSPWGQAEQMKWYSQQVIRRSYQEEVIDKINNLNSSLEVIQYARLPINPERYPLFLIKTKEWDVNKKSVLVTGGVHGYETSGVQGAIRFLQDEIHQYTQYFNFIVAPCISPWGYETINRWNPNAVDPNRSFHSESSSEEASFLLKAMANEIQSIYVHIDLHETTDTDNTIFRPALASRDGVTQDNWNIPDGFYTVGDSDKPVADFQEAIIESVKQVTHIAPADSSGRIIGELIQQQGVINYPTKKLGLCAGMTNADYVTTTEVYPDSEKVDDEECILAQVAAITGGLEFVSKRGC